MDNDLPAFLDPLLDYLSDALPYPLYAFVTTFLTQFIALTSGLFSLFSSLISSKPWQWDAQSIIPPLMSFLAAYLAILSLYRTTSWMVRSSLWFVKWGSIIGALCAGAGWYAGNGGGGANGIGGVGRVVSSFLMDALNGQGQNAAGGQRSTRKARTRSRTNKKPKAWDSFEEHEEWRYQEEKDAEGSDTGDAQKIIGDIIGAAGRVIQDGSWWDTAKGFVDSVSSTGGDEEQEEDDDRRRQPSRKAKAKAGVR